MNGDPAACSAQAGHVDPNAVASVVFKHCFMEGHIAVKGWDSMSSRDKDGREVVFHPEDSRLAEYGSSGPGAPKPISG